MSSAFIIRDHGTGGFRAERGDARKNHDIAAKGLAAPWTSTSDAHADFVNGVSETQSDAVIRLLHEVPSAHVLAELAAIDPQDLPHASRIDYLTAIERQESWLQALMHRAVVAVAGRESGPHGDPVYQLDDSEREDVSTALRLSPSGAQIKIDIARALTNYLPNTCSALATGEISAAHANAIARETVSALNRGLPESVIFEIENRAISYAEFHTPSQVGNLVRKVIAQRNPEEFEDSVASARELRRVTCFDESNGMSTIIALLPAHEAKVVMNAVEAFIRQNNRTCAQCLEEFKALSPKEQDRFHAQARDDHENCMHAGSDNRSKDMKRADALAAIASQYLSSTLDDVTPHRRPLTVNVTVDLPTLMGLAENPGELAGYGPIPASVAREIASDARWKRFVTEPITGNLLDFGREHYEPPQALKDFLIARDRTCRFPGCRRSAILSDLDHAQSWDSGGTTSIENLGALCRRHHKLKTHYGWQVESFADGSCMWRSPAGKEFFTPARSANEPV
jgi:hypothetical protein